MAQFRNRKSCSDLRLDVLISCMFQTDMSLVSKSKITGDAIIINQCDTCGFNECKTPFGKARMFSVTDRGLTKSRNLAISKSDADICLICDDDEVFEHDYISKILSAYKHLNDADIIVFKMRNRTASFPDRVMRLKFPYTLKVSSWQISFRRKSLIDNGVRFDELLGAGTGNGAEEELKFLRDCEKKNLKIYYVPSVIASVSQEKSTWFKGFDKQFFRNRGNTTRYILGLPLASVYAIYYVIKKRKMYSDDISMLGALTSVFSGIFENKISKQSKNINQQPKRKA